MNLLKSLFGGGSSGDDPNALYVYVKILRSGEVVRLRIHKGNDVSVNDEGERFVRKLVMGNQSFERVDATIYFDNQFRVTHADMPGGEIVTKAEYGAQQD
jgi:hypothetical protein